MTRTPAFHLNGLSTKAGVWMLRSPWFPVLFQVVGLALMLGLAINGWGLGTAIPERELMTLRKTNLTTLAVWGLWWPGMIVLAIAAGRLWCTVCPMELVSRVGRAIGRPLGLTRLPLGRFLRAGWLILAAYVLLQLLVAGLSIHRVPHYTSLLLMALGLLAVTSGLFFREERAFCKSFCPAAALLSVYGRFTPIQLDKVEEATCADCTTQDCVRASNRDRLDARSCPSRIRPYDRTPSDGCVLCFQCAKICPEQNIGFGVVRAEAGSRRRQLLRPAEAGFILIAAGFVAHEVIGELKGLDVLFHRVPKALHQGFPALGFGWFEALWFLVIFPAAFWALIVLGARLAGQRPPWREHLAAAATGAAPVIALAHLAKVLAKLGSWGGFLPFALRDPAGMNTLAGLSAGRIQTPSPLWGLSALGGFLLLGLALVGRQGWRRLRQHPEAHTQSAIRLGFLGAGALYAALFILWMRGSP